MDVTIPPIPDRYDDFRAEVRRFIDDHGPLHRLKPRAGLRVPDHRADVDDQRRWVQELYDRGWSVDRGGGDTLTDPFEVRIVAEELSGAGVPGTLGNPLVSAALQAFGTEEQQRRFLPPLQRGDHIWAQLFSEPDAGSDLASLSTRARLDGDHYVVDGQKVWSTWAQWSDYGYLLARTDPEAGKHAGISAFILDMASPGVEVRPLREMTGTTDFNEVFLSGVELPADHMIGAPGEGWKVANASLATERGGVGGGRETDEAVERLLALADLDRSADRQLIGRLYARARAQALLGHRTATHLSRNDPKPIDIPAFKVFFSELNLAITEAALRLQGPLSLLVDDDPDAVENGRWQDSFLYARAWTIAGGSNEVMRNVLAERGLGLPRDPKPTT